MLTREREEHCDSPHKIQIMLCQREKSNRARNEQPPSVIQRKTSNLINYDAFFKKKRCFNKF